MTEKCPNCGATVRPGAKFCTSCGTRLSVEPAAGAAPAPPTQSQGDPAGETQQQIPAAGAEASSDPPSFSTWSQAGSGWDTPSGQATGDASPEDRFEAAPDSKPESSSSTGAAASESTTYYRPATWGQASADSSESSDTEKEDRFASWAAAYGTTQAPPAESPAEPREEQDEAARIWRSPEQEEAPETAAVEPTGDPSEAHQRATELVEQLREAISQIGLDEATGDHDENLAVIVLAGARGQTGDFPDIQQALDILREDPRDIDALRDLGAKADRIEALLESHSRLLAAIDEAISEMR